MPGCPVTDEHALVRKTWAVLCMPGFGAGGADGAGGTHTTGVSVSVCPLKFPANGGTCVVTNQVWDMPQEGRGGVSSVRARGESQHSEDSDIRSRAGTRVPQHDQVRGGQKDTRHEDEGTRHRRGQEHQWQ